MRRSLALAAVLALAGPAVSGCASSSAVSPDVARAEIRTAQTAVSRAEQADATTNAPVAMRTARQKLEDAERAFSRAETDAATRLAEQAAVDAEFAEARSRAAVADAAVAEVRAAIDALRTEIERNRRAN